MCSLFKCIHKYLHIFLKLYFIYHFLLANHQPVSRSSELCSSTYFTRLQQGYAIRLKLRCKAACDQGVSTSLRLCETEFTAQLSRQFRRHPSRQRGVQWVVCAGLNTKFIRRNPFWVDSYEIWRSMWWSKRWWWTRGMRTEQFRGETKQCFLHSNWSHRRRSGTSHSCDPGPRLAFRLRRSLQISIYVLHYVHWSHFGGAIHETWCGNIV